MYRLRIIYFTLIAFLALNIHAQNLFIENKGQRDKLVKFSKQLSNGHLFYRENGFTTLLRENEPYDSMWLNFHQFKKLDRVYHIKHHRYDVNFLNSLNAVYEDNYIRQVRFDQPLEIMIDGRKHKGVILKP